MRHGRQGVPKPASLTFEQAAAVPIAATTALRGIRDVGEVKAGPAGARQRGRRRDGHVRGPDRGGAGRRGHGVCSTRNAGLVRSIGAAHVVDYTTEDFTGGRTRYDVILDNVSSLPLAKAAPGAHPEGDPRAQRWRFARPRVRAHRGHPEGSGGQPVRLAAAAPAPVQAEREELLAVTELIEGGKLTPVVGRTYPLADTAQGLRYRGAGARARQGRRHRGVRSVGA